jgi:hypothetical protein
MDWKNRYYATNPEDKRTEEEWSHLHENLANAMPMYEEKPISITVIWHKLPNPKFTYGELKRIIKELIEAECVEKLGKENRPLYRYTRL